MAFERSAFLDDNYVTSAASIMNYRAPPVVSERHTVIEDCRGLQFHYNTPAAPTQTIIFNPAHDHQYLTKREYQGSAYNNRAPIPLPPRVGYHHRPVFPSVTRREVPPSTQTAAVKPITSDEAARRFGGFVITEYRNKKQHHRA